MGFFRTPKYLRSVNDMPNWCSNSLTVTVNKDWYEKHKLSGYQNYGDDRLLKENVLKTFCDYMKTTYVEAPDFKVKTNYFDFRKIVAEPPGIQKGIINWYPWNTRHWGCKWNSHYAELLDYEWGEDGMIVYEFETPWGPPYSLLEEAVKLFPMLVFTISAEECGSEIDEKVIFKYDSITKYSHEYIEEPYCNYCDN